MFEPLREVPSSGVLLPTLQCPAPPFPAWHLFGETTPCSQQECATSLSVLVFCFVLFWFGSFWLLLQHMEVPWARDQIQATAAVMPDPSPTVPLPGQGSNPCLRSNSVSFLIRGTTVGIPKFKMKSFVLFWLHLQHVEVPGLGI